MMSWKICYWVLDNWGLTVYSLLKYNLFYFLQTNKNSCLYLNPYNSSPSTFLDSRAVSISVSTCSSKFSWNVGIRGTLLQVISNLHAPFCSQINQGHHCWINHLVELYQGQRQTVFYHLLTLIQQLCQPLLVTLDWLLVLPTRGARERCVISIIIIIILNIIDGPGMKADIFQKQPFALDMSALKWLIDSTVTRWTKEESVQENAVR